MRQIKFALSTTVLLFSLHATAQEPIDFSGVWQMDPSRSESAHQATPIGSFTLVIKQAATELSIETRRSEKPKSTISSETLTFKLDGSENSIEGNCGVQIKAQAHWDRTKLITETERSIQGSTVFHCDNNASIQPRREQERDDRRQHPDRPTRLPIPGSEQYRKG
jgi:hypothetical protein